uniref:GHMP kinase N-terminal domain-containing protein n=1 Tax=Leersia perrieri TaxID=77586 RepID=A0A0D9Y102_9ORYZ
MLPLGHVDVEQWRGENVTRFQNEGCYGGVRLLMAICKVFYSHCIQHGITLKEQNFTLSYDTNIPRQAGLSGSSAIICAALSCLLDFYNVRHQIKVETRPNLILDAEKELGIVAGLQDRDFRKEHMDTMGHGVYTPLGINLLPPLYLIYANNTSDSGKVHSSVRQRWLDGEEFIVSSMEEVAQLALDGHKALQMFGDDVIGMVNIKMVEVARSVGAAAKFTGSGGAVVALCPDGQAQLLLLQKACQDAGFLLQRIQVAPSCSFSSSFCSELSSVMLLPYIHTYISLCSECVRLALPARNIV